MNPNSTGEKVSNVTPNLGSSSLPNVPLPGTTGRRSFLKALGFTGAAVAAGMGAVPTALADKDKDKDKDKSHKKLTRGDADILRFLTAAELLETDFWLQYTELALN